MEELGPWLESQPDTRVFIINMCEMNKSMHINPFLFIEKKSDISKLPMDVGFFLDEFANTKMPSNFDKILATCRSRGIYCIPMLQSLAQIKTLFADGAWEGVVGNCDTFLYLGGNEASTFEYISKLLGKWTITQLVK